MHGGVCQLFTSFLPFSVRARPCSPVSLRVQWPRDKILISGSKKARVSLCLTETSLWVSMSFCPLRLSWSRSQEPWSRLKMAQPRQLRRPNDHRPSQWSRGAKELLLSMPRALGVYLFLGCILLLLMHDMFHISSCFQPGAILFLPRGFIWQCLEIFLVVTGRERGCCISTERTEARFAARHPTMHMAIYRPCQELSGPKSMSLLVPEAESLRGRQKTLNSMRV